MASPKLLKLIPEEMSLKNALPIIVENNGVCVDNAIQLELLQGWVKEVEQVGGRQDRL